MTDAVTAARAAYTADEARAAYAAYATAYDAARVAARAAYAAKGVVFDRQRWLPRANLLELCQAIQQGTPLDAAIKAFTEPIEETE